uniref:Uncharacterized protein n=1 Tax=Tanacetum cinerariifolium TaxID=118510 RepID=A0A6L2JUH2_TANCI|nr:hypothetical protein [Tanacetum cinerariifolium]
MLQKIRNKSNIDTISIDDLYNNFKIIEQDFKGTACSNSSSQDIAFVTFLSTNSTNEVFTAYGIITASTQSSTARKQPRNQDSRSWNQDSSRRTVNVEEIPPKAMVAIDGVGFDWSYMTEDEVPTNMALMAFSDSKEFQQPEFERYGPKSCKINSNNTSENIPNELKESTEVKESSDVLLVKKLVSDDKL